MNKRQLEARVGRSLRNRMESAIDDVIAELNAEGNHFTREFDGDPTEWIDRASRKRISITSALGVSAGNLELLAPAADPAVDRLLALADSGDRDAILLNQMEGDIANGGVFQLFENKGLPFMRRAEALLRQLGCPTKARLIRESLDAIEQSSATLKAYTALRRRLAAIDAKFDRSTENVAEQFLVKRP